VERVARVIAVLPKAQGSWNIDQTVDLVAQDERQQTIDSVDVEPSKVHVEIILKRAEVSKSVLLSAQMIGSPAAGYVVTGYQFQPSMVTINGTQEALRAISSITVPIQIDPELKQGFDHMVQITAPPGTSLNPADAADIHVRVDVSPISNAQATPAPATAPTPAAIPNAAPPMPPQTTPVPTGKEPL
jgi:YbbR domain-containing protein